MQKSHQVSIIALMLLGLLLFNFAQLELWQWLADDFRDGAWACGLIRQPNPLPASPLSGIEGRFLWTASLILLLLSIGLLLAASAYSLVQRLSQRRLPVAAALIGAILALLALAAGSANPDYLQFMQLTENQPCGFAAREDFLFTRYLLLIFQPYYQAATLDMLSYVEQLLPNLLLPTNLFLLLGLLSTVWLNAPLSCTLEGLAARIARFRLLLFSASTLFTATALYHMSEFNWFAQVLALSNSEGAALVYGLQRGITLYLGLINSLAMALFFLPSGWLLSRQAMALRSTQSKPDTPHEREEWLSQHGLKIFSGPLMKFGAIFAPLLVSGGMTLLQRAIGI
jgi:hypothetical protein